MHSRWEHGSPSPLWGCSPLPSSSFLGGHCTRHRCRRVHLSVQGDLVPFRTFHLFCLQRKDEELPIL